MRLQELRDTVSRQVEDVNDLVSLLELTIEDILDRFPDHLLDFKHKFGVTDPSDE